MKKALITFSLLFLGLGAFNNCSNPTGESSVQFSSAPVPPPPPVPVVDDIRRVSLVIEARTTAGVLVPNVKIGANLTRNTLPNTAIEYRQSSREIGKDCSLWATSPIYQAARTLNTGTPIGICDDGIVMDLEVILPPGYTFVRWEIPASYAPTPPSQFIKNYTQPKITFVGGHITELDLVSASGQVPGTVLPRLMTVIVQP